jgi:hypothetical protein
LFNGVRESDLCGYSARAEEARALTGDFGVPFEAGMALYGLLSGVAARKDAELVSLRVGKYDPALIALADVGVSGT